MLKSLVRLWTVMADDLAIGCHTSAPRDSQTVASRVEHEGVSFLTITLPAFGSDFERCLDLGSVDSAAFLGFKRRGGLPQFLGGFLSRVFNSSGTLLDAPDIASIFAIRELCSVFKKMLLPCSDARVKAAITQYVMCEQEMSAWTCSDQDAFDFASMSAMLFREVFTTMDRKIHDGLLVPKHGPGATADKLVANSKYKQVEWTHRLERLFPYLENALPSSSYYKEQDQVIFLEPEAERPVRVITVPKTLKTPRIIAIEPTCMQYMQQAVLEPLVYELEGQCISSFPGQTDHGEPSMTFDLFGGQKEALGERVTYVPRPPGYFFSKSLKNFAEGFIGFRDQNPNRDLARTASISMDLATLDLSEASDRVSNRHVELLINKNRFPHFAEAVQATRSLKADVPGHGIMPLTKFASMGSALCFPMEAMVFLTVVFIGIQRKLSKPLTRRQIDSLRGKVRVYGDDIIVPVEYVSSVIEALETFGFRVNSKKSFWTGKFRESCGGDFYEGIDVTPIRLKHTLPKSRKDVSAVVSAVEFRNHAYRRGLWRTAAFLDHQIVRVLPHFPIVKDTSPALGRYSYLQWDSLYNIPQRVGGRHQKPLVKAYGVRNVARKSILDDYFALQKFFLKRGSEPFDRKHLERTGRPEAVDIKLRWWSQA